MCGRFTLTDNIVQLQAFFEFDFDEETIPRYNIAPGQKILTILSDGLTRKGRNMKWGLVPSWARDEKIGYKMINARGETIEEKPSFKQAFQRRRCLILADGFYEWKKTENGKQPYRFVMKDRKPFAFAGIWETWTNGTQPLTSCTIITTGPNDVTKDVHDRMPVILPTDTYERWLDPGFQQIGELKDLLQPYPAEEMEKYEVSTLVNAAKNELPELITPLNSL